MDYLTSYIKNDDPPHAEWFHEAYVRAAEELLLPCPSTPISDFSKLTRATGGLRPREFSILCGATGIGKTTLIANWSKSWLLQNVPHFVASVETGSTDFVKRVISCLVKKDWNTGDPVDEESFKTFHAKYFEVVRRKLLSLSLYDSRFSVEQLMSDIAWMVKNRGCKIAVIDNLNFFLEIKKSSDQIMEMDRVVHELIIFCKRIDVHVIMVMHPRKTTGRVDSEFDIKGSSTAVQEAHNIFLFNRAGDDLKQQDYASGYDRELKIAKMRRKGRIVGARLVLKTLDGVSYEEGEIL